jgi:hypothetical protein
MVGKWRVRIAMSGVNQRGVVEAYIGKALGFQRRAIRDE